MDQEIKDEFNKLEGKIDKNDDVVHHRIDEKSKENREDFQRIYDRVDEATKDANEMGKMAAEMAVVVNTNKDVIRKHDKEIQTAKSVAYEAKNLATKMTAEAMQAVSNAEKKCKDNADSAVKTAIDDFRKNEFAISTKDSKTESGKIWKVLAWSGVFLVTQLIAIIWYLVERG